LIKTGHTFNLFYLHVLTGVQVAESVCVKALFLDMSIDASASTMWQAIKQFNGYSG